MTKVEYQIHTNLRGLKKNQEYLSNMDGYFNCGNEPLSDHMIRVMIDYGIEHGYRTEADIPAPEVKKLLSEHKNDKILTLTIKKEWFNKIIKGEKNEEYRDLKPYWVSRFIKDGNCTLKTNRSLTDKMDISWKKFDYVRFICGRDANKCYRIEKKIESLSIGLPKEGLCPKEFLGKYYFVIKFKY